MKYVYLILILATYFNCKAQTVDKKDSARNAKLSQFVFVNTSKKPFLKGDTIKIDLTYEYDNSKISTKLFDFFVLNQSVNSGDSFQYFRGNDSLIINPKYPKLNSLSYFIKCDSLSSHTVVYHYYFVANSFYQYYTTRHYGSSIYIDDYHPQYIDNKKEIKNDIQVEVQQSILGLEIKVSRNLADDLYRPAFTIDTYLGRTIAEGDILFEKGSKEATIRIENIPKGSYSITIGQGSTSKSAFFQVK